MSHISTKSSTKCFQLRCFEPLGNQVKTLQDMCRTVILRSVTLERLRDVNELPIPALLQRDFITTLRIPEDFDVEQDFLDYHSNFPNHVHHPSHRIHPSVCRFDNRKVLIKSQFMNRSCQNCKALGGRHTDNNQRELWSEIRHPNVMACLFTLTDPKLYLFCYVLEYPLITLPDYAFNVHTRDMQIPEYLVWRTLHRLCGAFEYLRKNDIYADELCQPQHMYLDERGEIKIENLLLYAELGNGPVVVHSNMVSFCNPPEKITGRFRRPDSTEVWGIGCALYELTGYMPPRRYDSNAIYGRLLNGLNWPPSMQYSKAVYSVLLKLMITSCLDDLAARRPPLAQLKRESFVALEHLGKTYDGPRNLLSFALLNTTG